MQVHGITHTTTATTATALSAASLQTGWRWRVVGLHLSVSGAAIVTIGFSATNQRVYDLAANQTLDLLLNWEGDSGAALTVQSSAAVSVDCTADALPELAN